MKQGMRELRHMVRNFDGCLESFLDRFTAEQLLVLHRAWMASGWDISPDYWSEEQVQEALKGVPPKFES